MFDVVFLRLSRARQSSGRASKLAFLSAMPLLRNERTSVSCRSETKAWGSPCGTSSNLSRVHSQSVAGQAYRVRLLLAFRMQERDRKAP